MEPFVHVITLAVDDLQRALTFYRDGLGLPTTGIVADEYEGSDTEAAPRTTSAIVA
jgi:catechol 2,3-dioxygenase-like lactoylglutathione lyase family enzyme